MTFPDYPEDIDTPETLYIIVNAMRNHAGKIGALDWVMTFKDLQKLLFWAAEVRLILEAEEGTERNGEIKQ